MIVLLLTLPAVALLALVFALWKTAWISKQDPGTPRMQQVAGFIARGAMAFLKSEYKILAWVVFGISAFLFVHAYGNKQSSAFIALSFILGAGFSALAGYLGMRVATKANVRTTAAAQISLTRALAVAYSGGSVMGMCVVGLGLLGLSSLFIIFFKFLGSGYTLIQILSILSGYSLGASTIALFARVGGGIYTKAADVGGDLVGKIEAGIPEDHPLNPATIADNVGDNVGDVAGMGADLFESYAGALIGAMVLGATFLPGLMNALSTDTSLSLFYLPQLNEFRGLAAVILPLALAALGIICSIAGTFLVRVKEGQNPQKSLNYGGFFASGLFMLSSYFVIQWILPTQWIHEEMTYTSMRVYWATLIGLATGLLIGYITEVYTGSDYKHVKNIARESTTGAATNIIAGLGLGMQSTGFPILFLSMALVFSYQLAGLYGIAMAAVGMLANTGIQLAVDAYGPISDNAGGIAQMAELPEEVRDRTDKLDAVGNTTAAIGKGFAIGSAALTALALFVAYMHAAKIKVIDLGDPRVMAGLFIGGMLPYVFSAMALNAVGNAAMSMVQEVRRQFNDIPELKAALEVLRKHGAQLKTASSEEIKIFHQADGKPDYEKCIRISTQAALQQMILPGLMAIGIPVFIGFMPSLGATTLAGVLAGVTVSGVLLAIFQANAGGAWDNAKKTIERGMEWEGILHEKGSLAHKATVVGDTVGDPLKDTAGPSLNILVKLMSIVALIIAPSL